LKAHTAAKVDRRQSHRAPREDRAVVPDSRCRQGLGDRRWSWHPGVRSRRACATRGFSPARSRRSRAILHPGTPVTVVAADGTFLASAAYSPASQIRARVWSFDSQQTIDTAFITRTVARAATARVVLFDKDHTAGRILHGESDGLPGVIADRYR
jgi:23S rRNA G2069 N7-methylase RlmK/C1962 C5-methylase RlmI